MSLLLLDTTFLIDAERSKRSLDRVISDEDDVAIAAITVAELLVGVQLAATRFRQTRADYVQAIVDAIPIITYDSAVAQHHADLLVSVRKMGRRRGAHDLIIAATGRAMSRTIISADRSAFADLPGVTALDHRDPDQ